MPRRPKDPDPERDEGCKEETCVYPYCVWCVAHRFTRLRPDGGCDDCDDGVLGN